jgi:hypothetical protein
LIALGRGSGNHEADQYPYGISPRVPMKGKVNAGIPLDHNLTIYEAILLYGPAYGKLIPFPNSGDGRDSLRLNFNAKNFDWFYTLFTPLTDFVVHHGEQCLLALQWGDGEDYLKDWSLLPPSYGGALPRASKSLDGGQQSLKANHIPLRSIAQHNSPVRILCSHFTQVNYALCHPLSARGEINCNDAFKEYGSFDHGSIESGRAELYGEWLALNQFTFTLSGHSHRAGLYRCVSYEDNLLGRKNMTVSGEYPENANLHQSPWRDCTKLLVSASAGPMPKQNLQGEMSGNGMEYPSASFIGFNGGQSIKLGL